MFHDALQELMHHIDTGCSTDDGAGGVDEDNSSAAGNVAVVHDIIREASTDIITIDASLAPRIEDPSAGSVHDPSWASWALYNAAKDPALGPSRVPLFQSMF